MTEIVDYNRKFQIWSYTVSHGQLLLRSNKSESIMTRVDILFKNVSTINLPTIMDGLKIYKLDTNLGYYIPEVLHPPSQLVFKLMGDGFEGHVCASSIFWEEDQGTHSDPSSIPGIWSNIT